MKAIKPALLFVLATVFGVDTAHAASSDSAYPLQKPIRLVVPFTPGSATDIMARLVGSRLADLWSRQVVTDNRPSAGGIVACQIVAEAAPDGHTLLVTGSNFAGSAALYSKLPFDSVRDFAGVSQLGSTPLVLVVSPSLGPKSVKELVALAREKPGQLNFASTGLGSGTHYGAELFKLSAGIAAVHVPYRGTPESLTDLMAGRVHFFIAPVLVATPLIKSGKVLGLAVTSAQRAAPLPEIPTMAEAGLPKAGYEGWYAMLAPVKTPRRIVNALSKQVGRILEQGDIREKIATQGAAAKPSTPEGLERMIRDEIETRRKVWQAAGVKVE